MSSLLVLTWGNLDFDSTTERDLSLASPSSLSKSIATKSVEQKVLKKNSFALVFLK